MGKIHDRFKNKATRGAALNRALTYITSPKKPTTQEPHAHDSLDTYEVQNAFRKQKYIIVDHWDLGEVALTFPNFLVHREMAERVFRRCAVVAAGFFDIYPDLSVKVYGRSESLDINSRVEKDPKLIRRSLGI